MKRNFAQVLQSANIDLKREYSKLYHLFYDKDKRDGKSLADLISSNFEQYYFCGTCLDLEEFNITHNILFVDQPQEFDIDYLVLFCEYVYNFVLHTSEHLFFGQRSRQFYLEHIYKVIEAIGYMESKDGWITIFVPKDSVAISVSKMEVVPENISYKIVSYNHHSKKGDLETKKQILLAFADILEPKRKELDAIDQKFSSDLFYAFNNFNIRHNNISPDSAKYKKSVAGLTPVQLEEWYDETYQMCLLAFMRLEHKERKRKFDEFKSKIENK